MVLKRTAGYMRDCKHDLWDIWNTFSEVQRKEGDKAIEKIKRKNTRGLLSLELDMDST